MRQTPRDMRKAASSDAKRTRTLEEGIAIEMLAYGHEGPFDSSRRRVVCDSLFDTGDGCWFELLTNLRQPHGG
jgi:hypothetical protein